MQLSVEITQWKKLLQHLLRISAILCNQQQGTVKPRFPAQEEQFKDCKFDMYCLVLDMNFTPEWIQNSFFLARWNFYLTNSRLGAQSCVRKVLYICFF